MKVSELGRTVGETAMKRIGRLAGRLQEESPLDVDVLEGEDEYLVVFDAAGAETSDVQVRYVGRDVVVRIDRFRDYREGYEMRYPGRGLALDGRATLPADAVVDAEHARAVLREDGTLRVYLPKESHEDDAERDVEVESEEPTRESESDA